MVTVGSARIVASFAARLPCLSSRRFTCYVNTDAALRLGYWKSVTLKLAFTGCAFVQSWYPWHVTHEDPAPLPGAWHVAHVAGEGISTSLVARL